MNYNEVRLTLQQKAIAVFIAGGLCFLIGFIFYKNIGISLMLSSLGLLYPKYFQRSIIAKRKDVLRQQFQQALHILSSALAAGRSVENAFAATMEDLRLLYPTDRADIIREWERILQFIRNGEPIESALNDFSSRAGLDEVAQFADVFQICKRSGGNMVEVMRQTAAIIGEKMEVQQDINVLLSRKKFEARILFVLPLIFIALLSLGSPEYMIPLYTGIGRIIMSVSLAVLIFCYWWHHKLMKIDL